MIPNFPDHHSVPAVPAPVTKKKKPPNPVISGRVYPETNREIERVARRMAGGRPSVLVGMILNAWARGNHLCPPCGHEHAVRHPGDDRYGQDRSVQV